MMAETRFQRLLDRHGGDPAAWPSAQRREAEALLARSSDARARQAQAQRLDRGLDAALRAGAPSEGLRARVHALPAAATVRPRPRGPRPAWLLLGSGAAAAALLLGVAVGAAGVLGAPAGGATLETLVYGPGAGAGVL
jgi:hypothetical protein